MFRTKKKKLLFLLNKISKYIYVIVIDRTSNVRNINSLLFHCLIYSCLNCNQKQKTNKMKKLKNHLLEKKKYYKKIHRTNI